MIGLSYGTMKSLRRGSGTDVAGSRPYRPGDDMDSIDWAASARLSTARGADEFVVRERFAEEAPKVIIVCDRRPEMACYGPPLPWLDKPMAMRTVVELVLASAGAAGGFVGYLDYADGDPHWRQPKGSASSSRCATSASGRRSTAGAADWLERSIEHLASHTRAVTPGTFVFLLSDFIPSPSHELWLARDRASLGCRSGRDPGSDLGAELPDVDGIVVRFAIRARVASRPLACGGRKSRPAEEEHRERTSGLLETFRQLDIDPVVVTSSDRGGHPRGVPDAGPICGGRGG